MEPSLIGTVDDVGMVHNVGTGPNRYLIGKPREAVRLSSPNNNRHTDERTEGEGDSVEARPPDRAPVTYAASLALKQRLRPQRAWQLIQVR